MGRGQQKESRDTSVLTLEATLQAVDEIQKTIETADCGWKNDEAISAIKFQIRHIRWGRSDPYIREKVGIIEAYTDILYRTICVAAGREWQGLLDPCAALDAARRDRLEKA
ncbi:MAG: hypothetical protein JWQ49_2033 [Edaphobacter sp.]|nr:hypothetical protein [Edaphobacter sp.]